MLRLFLGVFALAGMAGAQVTTGREGFLPALLPAAGTRPRVMRVRRVLLHGAEPGFIQPARIHHPVGNLENAREPLLPRLIGRRHVLP